MSECLRRESQNLVRGLPRMCLQASTLDSRHNALRMGFARDADAVTRSLR